MKVSIKTVFYVSTLFIFLFLFSCTKKETYTVLWSINGVIVEADDNVLRETKPEYNGPTPTRKDDDNYIYVFNGWSRLEDQEIGIEESLLSGVKSDVTYYAAFIKKIKEYVF